MSPTETNFFNFLMAGCFISAPFTFALLLRFNAPYGRHARKGWGPTFSSATGWFLMEFAAVVVIVVAFLVGNGFVPGAAWFLIALWELHYIHRAVIYPLRRRGSGKNVTLTVVVSAFVFQLVLGYLNGRHLGLHPEQYNAEWLTDPRFIVGAALFLTGFVINFWADDKLLRLRREKGSGYHIPRGGLYERVSCPNYLGEIIEWTGWAVATWSLPGLLFLVWTLANLLPRAFANHNWYRQTFPDYPATRKAVIPHLY